MRKEYWNGIFSQASVQGVTKTIHSLLPGRDVTEMDPFDRTTPFDLPDEMQETPKRWLEAMREMTEGYDVDVSELFKAFDHEDKPGMEMVTLRDIEFSSVCAHHLLPFVGVAHIGYIPFDRIIGLSKLARLVDAFGKRFQVQERMGRDIANAIETHLKPKGVGVVIEARHTCMGCRGVRKPNAVMGTSVMRGAFLESASTRSEFLALVGKGR